MGLRHRLAPLFGLVGGFYRPIRSLDLGSAPASAVSGAGVLDWGAASGGTSAPVVAKTGSDSVTPGAYSNAAATGAVVLTLAQVTAKSRYRFTVMAAQNLTVAAPAGATIRVGSQVSALGGSISSNVVGATIELVAVADNQLVAQSTVEVW